MTNTFTDFCHEVQTWCDYYHLKYENIATILQHLAPQLAHYAELTMTETQLEVITAASGFEASRDFAIVAREHGLSRRTVETFLQCHSVFPQVEMGIKLNLTHLQKPPTLYVRTKTATPNGIAFIKSLVGFSEAAQSLDKLLHSTSTLYGLGFTDTMNGSHNINPLLIKTYHLKNNCDGQIVFSSHRLHNDQVLDEEKEYIPNQILDNHSESAELSQLQQFAKEKLHYTRADHDSFRKNAAGVMERKLYFERIGGIATDFSAL